MIGAIAGGCTFSEQYARARLATPESTPPVLPQVA